MKFCKLQARQRTALANLTNCGSQNTDKLAKAMGISDMRDAAHMLCAMRSMGLIYSKERAAGAQYASWTVTDYGTAVFDNRPDGVSAERADKVAAFAKAYNAGLDAVTQLSASAKPTAYAVVPDTGFQVGTYEDALECAKAAAIGMSKPYIVIAMVAEVLPPVAPQPVVNVL